MDQQQELHQIFRTAVKCNVCFEDGVRLQRSFIDVAQPRLIGKKYWTCPVKILILMINPGKGRDDDNHRRGAQQIRAFGSGQNLIGEIFENQRKDLGNWGKFLPFYQGSLGLQIDELALANVAWCSTARDEYPGWMLNECFSRHTAALVKALTPDVILLSGSNVHGFKTRVEHAAPNARVVLTPHYAHREGLDYERAAARRILNELGQSPSATRTPKITAAAITPVNTLMNGNTEGVSLNSQPELPDSNIRLSASDLAHVRAISRPYGIDLDRWKPSTVRKSGSVYVFTYEPDGQMIFCLDSVWKKAPKRWIRFDKRFAPGLRTKGLIVNEELGGGHNCSVYEESLASALDVCAAVYPRQR